MLYSFLQLHHCYAACMKLLCNYTRCGIWWGWEEYNLGQQYKMKIGISSTSVETRNILHKSFPNNFLCIRYQKNFWFWDSNKLISWHYFLKSISCIIYIHLYIKVNLVIYIGYMTTSKTITCQIMMTHHILPKRTKR